MTAKEDRRGDALRLADMLSAAERIGHTLAEGKDRFFANPDALDATIRRLEVLGEAAGKVTETTRSRYPSIPWRKMHGFASLAKHEDWKVNPERVWEAVEATAEIRSHLARARTDISAGAVRRE
jgi:uncharacterized protein with HEPN domain